MINCDDKYQLSKCYILSDITGKSSDREAKEDNQCKLSSQLHNREIKEIRGHDIQTDSDACRNKEQYFSVAS